MTKATSTQTFQNNDNTETVAASLATLEISSLNPRQNPNEEGLEALALSIKAVGLLQNLIGIKKGKKIGIVAGGRRLRALQLLSKNGDIAKDASFLVRLATSEEQALQWAATENEARENLSPADEVRAYKAMVDAGMKASDIAIANAKTERHVKGRLRLTALSEIVLNGLEKGEITLDTAAAYTICDSHEKQNEVYESLNSHDWFTNDANRVRSSLSSDIPDERDIRVSFVGRELYEQQGGTVREDLFGEQVFFPDITLLDKLAQDKMDQVVIDLKAEGWKWADMQLARKPWDFAEGFDVLHPVQPTIDEATETRMEELEGLMNEETISPEELEEFDALEKVNAPFYRDHAKAVSGVTAFIGHQNEIVLVTGLVREEDVDDAIAAGLMEIEEDQTSASRDENPTPYSQALAADLSTIRTGAIQAQILAHPDFARDLAIFALCYPMYQGVSPITMQKYVIKNQVEDHGQILPEELDFERLEHMDHHEALEAFTRFMELSDKMKLALLTETVAKSFAATLFFDDRHNALLEDIVDRLGVNTRKTWTPNTTFFKRMKSDQLDEVMAYILQRPAAQSFTKMNKRDKVARLHALFNNEVDRRGFSEPEKLRISIWSPECISATKTTNEVDDNYQDETVKEAA